ncbi:hydroxymethylbilane synthase [Sanguibacter sp. HDW7]|uniref:hydroxymethylbilane synthase n=1 Tax=Sanguibacter sp. HDW7 TaxID=2714931 RepID=UPI0014084EF9|nr:hydroxymethylbilane synthase [Sanguibacter sp. HDW7]QIK84617.1 hydroxymethylbilane synthase [Sanguibacter sp. HDW7]
MSVVRVGTRASELARTQTGHVTDALSAAASAAGTPLALETVHVTTEGDTTRASLAQLGGTGVFVAALRDALLDGRIDVAVHSLKDLPTAPARGLTVAAMPPRESPLDALVARDGLTLAGLPRGARIGTGSPRRRAQLLAARPDLEVVDIRGNVGTRIARALGPDADLDAVVLAAAGLARIGRTALVTEPLDPSVMTPAPGQGVLAVETRTDAQIPGLAALDHVPSRLAATAERALLARLEAGCAAPVGALAAVSLDGARMQIDLDVVVASLDGTRVLRHGASQSGPVVGAGTYDLAAAVESAQSLGINLAEIIFEMGAADIAPLR